MPNELWSIWTYFYFSLTNDLYLTIEQFINRKSQTNLVTSNEYKFEHVKLHIKVEMALCYLIEIIFFSLEPITSSEFNKNRHHQVTFSLLLHICRYYGFQGELHSFNIVLTIDKEAVGLKAQLSAG